MLDTATVQIDEVIANVRQRVGDEMAPHKRSRGYYIGHIRRALIDLAYDTLFDKRNFDAAIPESLVVDLPTNIADITHMWLYNGDKCDFNNSKNLYWHRGFTRYGSGNYFAENKFFNDDPIIEDAGWCEPGDLYSYGIQNGKLMLSSQCQTFERVHILYLGTGQTAGEEPPIPQMLLGAVEDYVTWKYYQFAQGRDPRTFRTLVQDARSEYETPFTGSKARALHNVRRVLTKQARDMSKYLTSFGYGA